MSKKYSELFAIARRNLKEAGGLPDEGRKTVQVTRVTQRQLAEKIGVTDNSLSMTLGKNNPQLSGEYGVDAFRYVEIQIKCRLEIIGDGIECRLHDGGECLWHYAVILHPKHHGGGYVKFGA